MFKVIWKKNEHKQLSETIKSQGFTLIHDETELKDDEIGIICDEQSIQKIKPLLEEITFEKAQMIFPTPDGWTQIYAHQITYIESYGQDIWFHMKDLHKIHIKQPLYQLESILQPYHFCRIGKSYIVNLREIRYIRVTLNAKLELELSHQEKVYVSRSYVRKFKDALDIK